MQLLQYKKNVTRKSPNILQLYFIWHRVNINRNTFKENEKKHRSKEKCGTSHFKLQMDLVRGRGNHRFGAKLIRNWQRFTVVHQPGCFFWNVYLGELGLVCEEKEYCGKPLREYRVAKSMWMATPCCAGSPALGIGPARSACVVQPQSGPTVTFAPWFCFTVGIFFEVPPLFTKAVKEENRDKLFGLWKRR